MKIIKIWKLVLLSLAFISQTTWAIYETIIVQNYSKKYKKVMKTMKKIKKSKEF